MLHSELGQVEVAEPIPAQEVVTSAQEPDWQVPLAAVEVAKRRQEPRGDQPYRNWVQAIAAHSSLVSWPSASTTQLPEEQTSHTPQSTWSVELGAQTPDEQLLQVPQSVPSSSHSQAPRGGAVDVQLQVVPDSKSSRKIDSAATEPAPENPRARKRARTVRMIVSFTAGKKSP